MIPVLKDLSESEEMKTVQRTNANYLSLFNHEVIVYFFVAFAFLLLDL